MRAYHFLRADWTAGSGDEPPWTIGEERVIDGEIALCKRGYHYGADWLVALSYAPGPVACVVDVDEGPPDSTGKGVSRRRKLIDGADCTRELRLFARDCAERVLLLARNAGREPNVYARTIVKAAQRVVSDHASLPELARGLPAVTPVDLVAARAAGLRRGSVDLVAADAIVEAEREWQRQRLSELLDARLAEVGPMEAEDV